MSAPATSHPIGGRSHFGLGPAQVVLGLLLGFSAGAADIPAAASEAGFRWSAFLGPFHMVVLHFPIGFIAAAAALQALGWKYPSAGLRLAVQSLLWLTVASGLVASGAGLLRASEGGFDPEGVDEHRNLALAFVAVTLGAAIAGHFAHRPSHNPKPRLVLAFRGLFVFALLLVGPAGHHGGNLTHGSDFLTAGAPPFLAKFLQPPAKPAASAVVASTDNSAASLYSTTIRPLFESRCYACHGPEKHKGDYRLDVRDIALRGGDSGSPGITPGEPMKSNVLRLMLLPRDHDDAMPPEGKQAATPEEITAVAHWIQGGAPFEPAAP
jgi:cytochrome c5/uncharacterized membrane protein